MWFFCFFVFVQVFKVFWVLHVSVLFLCLWEFVCVELRNMAVFLRMTDTSAFVVHVSALPAFRSGTRFSSGSLPPLIPFVFTLFFFRGDLFTAPQSTLGNDPVHLTPSQLTLIICDRQGLFLRNPTGLCFSLKPYRLTGRVSCNLIGYRCVPAIP